MKNNKFASILFDAVTSHLDEKWEVVGNNITHFTGAKYKMTLNEDNDEIRFVVDYKHIDRYDGVINKTICPHAIAMALCKDAETRTEVNMGEEYRRQITDKLSKIIKKCNLKVVYRDGNNPPRFKVELNDNTYHVTPIISGKDPRVSISRVIGYDEDGDDMTETIGEIFLPLLNLKNFREVMINHLSSVNRIADNSMDLINNKTGVKPLIKG